jgi:uncharacterized protein (DUF1800 family)
MAAVAIDPRAMDGKALAAFTLHRFGLGPRPGGIDRIASDPRGALLAELRPGAGRIADGTLLTSKAAIGEAAEFRQQRKVAHEERRMQDGARAMTPNGDKPEDSGGKGMIPLPQRIYLAEAKARYEAALKPDVGFAERLVWFWSNHFCVSADKGPTRAVCGAYEREAIRPHILGKFADMLLAAESHPAMLLYLDNARSIGPGSIAGIRRGKGLNENLAREILELHTLGVRTGYTQTDVTNFAKVITGWTIVPPRLSPEHGGEFWFNARMHEPGPQVVVGRSYADEGFAQGRKVLTDLAHHPATAKHIATKLARHFVADEPPPALVNKLSKRFRDTGGDLMEVTKTLVTAPETWAAPRNKLKPPGEWIVAALRAMDLPIRDVRKVVGAQALLGEPLWRPPAPKGFSDDSAAWLDGLAQRLDIANRVGRVVGNLGQEPDDIINTALGPLASAETREAIGRAESRPQALALLLMAPEFQRR